MGRRGSSDRLEALSLEIERKLHKVTHRFPYVRRLAPVNSCSSRLIEDQSLSRARARIASREIRGRWRWRRRDCRGPRL